MKILKDLTDMYVLAFHDVCSTIFMLTITILVSYIFIKVATTSKQRRLLLKTAIQEDWLFLKTNIRKKIIIILKNSKNNFTRRKI